VHLAYLDETGTDGHSPIVMYGALIVPVGKFGHLASLHSTAIQQILPIEKMDEFKEFHASEIYNGKGAFEGIDEPKRLRAIQVLLEAVRMDELPFIYAAIDRKKFASSPFCTANPLLTAFHLCLLGIEDWATANHPSFPGTKRLDWNDTYLCIADDNKNNREVKEQLLKTYRTLRAKHPFIPPYDGRLWHAHDNMFFADSSDCLGIQIADLCAYFVRRHLLGDSETEDYYQRFSNHIICAKPEPEAKLYKHLFCSHLGV
jgi:Protein of unknown function (DUF3800)